MRTSDSHCGACGEVCDSVNGFACLSGACACTSATATVCDEACVDTDTDPDHCGACGEVCDSVNGETCCSGVCTEIGTVDNCTACGDVCDTGETCQSADDGCQSPCLDFTSGFLTTDSPQLYISGTTANASAYSYPHTPCTTSADCTLCAGINQSDGDWLQTGCGCLYWSCGNGGQSLNGMAEGPADVCGVVWARRPPA